MSQILVGSTRDAAFDGHTLDLMFRFRHKVFYERLQWDVANEDGIEKDEYDQLNPSYIIARNDQKEIEACVRLLPTTGPYMLQNTFPQLLRDKEPPRDPAVWELSRFAVMPSHSNQQSQATLSELTFSMLRSIYDFADRRGIHRYILVTSAALERLLRRIGLPLIRFEDHAAQHVGKVLTVVCWLEVDDRYWRAVYEHDTGRQVQRVAA